MPEPTGRPFRSVEELIAYAEKNPSQYKTNQKSIFPILDKLYKEACQHVEKNERESAFILFTRYMNCFTNLRASKEFQNDEKYLKDMVGPTVKEVMRYWEELKKELQENYDILVRSEREEKLKASRNSVDTINRQKPPITVPQGNGLSSTFINDVITVQPSHEKKISITCKELYEIGLKNLKNALLVIDVRLRDDFALSSMKLCLVDVINIPEPSLIPSKLEAELEEKFRPFFKKRGDYDQVVILDWFSTKDTLECDKQTPIFLMISKLKKYDPNVKYKKEPVILEGGYDEWLSRYPARTTNANVSPPQRKSNDKKISIDQISYPTTAILEPEKVEPKPTTPITLPQVNSSKPNVDRSTKPIIPEKKPENNVKENGNIVYSENETTADPKENSNELNKASKEKNIPKTKPESFEEDEEELKKQSIRNGRRSALTTLSNQSFPVGNNIADDSDSDIDEASRNEEKENRMNAMKNASINIYHDMGSGMKRYSSTPNIAKIENEYSKPPIDRSVKPSNDDQLNIFSKNSMRSDEEIQGLTGLLNVGNTCYMNSILQCLSNTDSLRKVMCNLPINYSNSKSKTEGIIAREVGNVIKQLWKKDSGPISCRTLKNYVGRYRDTFRGSEQQDSHEFLTILIDWLHEDLNEPAVERCLKGADEKSGEKSWGEFVSKNNSKIRQLFYGQQKSTVSCNMCEKESVTFEPFSNLSLPLPSAEKCTLAECLKLYTNNEHITGWQCPGCKSPRAATKKLDITKLPPYLVMHFKRFTSDGWCRKRLTNVDFPDLLDMTPFIIGQEHRNRRYELYAVSNHMGTMETGHYTAYCRNSFDKRWYKFDDDNVSRINTVAKSSSAYIVFYKCLLNN